ncbi:hypothetical protein J2Z22_001606 [Paenibacillus forsythiae]|uniref:Phage abortive infection protein n=1 Tax=Paenibacillus forsythiae TaxID=365616 RepID=A0ABU3H5I9_9BACL|nr:hypothetical protein [Paenibacillus forsythiae]MDT3426086.1 hypothetical protein [Paenibacillus forsythiae]
MMVKEQTKETWSLSKIIWFVVILWVLLGTVAYFLSDNWVNRGTFGDMFGSINALVSALAFAGLLYTIHLQREDLSIQRKSFDNQLKELQHQVENTKKQLEITKYQSYQETLKYLFEVKAKAIENIKYYKWDEEIRQLKVERSGNDFLDLFNRLEESEIGKFDREKYNLPRYFQIYKNILQFIIEADVSHEQRKNLQDILNIEISDSEVCLLYVLNSNDQHMMMLMASNGLHDRYKTILETSK